MATAVEVDHKQMKKVTESINNGCWLHIFYINHHHVSRLSEYRLETKHFNVSTISVIINFMMFSVCDKKLLLHSSNLVSQD